MLMPKKVKHRKQQRGRITGAAKGGDDGRLRRLRDPGARAGLDHRPPDRGGPYRDDPPRPPWWQGLDPGLPGQARHPKAGRDPHGLGQGQPRALGRRRAARAGSCSSSPASTRRSRARRWSARSRSCRSRRSSSCVPGPAASRRWRSDGQGRRASRARRRGARCTGSPRRARSCSTCGSSSRPGRLDNVGRHQPRCARDIARLLTVLREREIAAAEALTGRRLMTEAEATATEAPRPNRARSARASVVSDSMDKTAVVAVVERVRHARVLPRRCCAPSGSTSTTRRTTAAVGDRVRVVETRPISKLKRWRLVEIMERATMIQQESRLRGGRQLRRERGALHQGARRLAPPLRLDRRRLHRDREGRRPRCGGEEGRRRALRRRADEEGAPPSRRQLHPLRRERRRAHQRPACSRVAPASSARSAASCATSGSCGSSRSPRR